MTTWNYYSISEDEESCELPQFISSELFHIHSHFCVKISYSIAIDKKMHIPHFTFPCSEIVVQAQFSFNISLPLICLLSILCCLLVFGFLPSLNCNFEWFIMKLVERFLKCLSLLQTEPSLNLDEYVDPGIGYLTMECVGCNHLALYLTNPGPSWVWWSLDWILDYGYGC
jgi:hypothetical protein